MITKIKISDKLKEAKELIGVPERWTTGTAARNSVGSPVNVNDCDAVCWRAVGSVHYVTSGYCMGCIDSMLVLRKVIFGEFIAAYNDTHSHEEVMDMFDRAIELAEKDEQNEV